MLAVSSVATSSALPALGAQARPIELDLASLVPVVRAVLIVLVFYLSVKLRKSSSYSKHDKDNASLDDDDDDTLNDTTSSNNIRHNNQTNYGRRTQSSRNNKQLECTCQPLMQLEAVESERLLAAPSAVYKNAVQQRQARQQAIDTQLQFQLQCRNPNCSAAAKQKLPMPPGPMGLPFVGYLPFLGKEIHLTLTTLSNKYGPIYQIFLGGIRVLVLNDATLIRQAFKQPVFSGRPDTQLTRLLQGYGIVNSGGALWKEQRAFLHSTLRKLGAKSLMGANGLEAKIQTQVRELVKDLSGHATDGKACQVRPILARAVSSVVGSIVMNLTYRKYEEKAKFDRLIELMQEGFRLFTIAMPLDFIPIFRFLPGVSYAYKKMKKNRLETSAFFKSIAEEHRKYLSAKFNLINTTAGQSNQLALHPSQHQHQHQPQQKKPAQKAQRHQQAAASSPKLANSLGSNNASLDYIVARDLVDAYIVQQTKHEKDGKVNYFSDQQLIQIMSDIFSAGLETVTSTIEWSILFLILNPDCQTQIQNEIDVVIERERMPQLDDLSRMPYTEATIYEVLRRSNVVALGNTHATLADASLGGYRVPKGTHVLPNLYGIHMNPKLWNDPTKFDPSRFLINEKAHKPDYFIPFSVGRRMCLGDVLAKMEVFLFLVGLLQKYDLSVADEDKNSPPQVKGTIGVSNAPAAFRVAIRARAGIESPKPASLGSARDTRIEQQSLLFANNSPSCKTQQDSLAATSTTTTTATTAVLTTPTTTATAAAAAASTTATAVC